MFLVSFKIFLGGNDNACILAAIVQAFVSVFLFFHPLVGFPLADDVPALQLPDCIKQLMV